MYSLPSTSVRKAPEAEAIVSSAHCMTAGSPGPMRLCSSRQCSREPAPGGPGSSSTGRVAGRLTRSPFSGGKRKRRDIAKLRSFLDSSGSGFPGIVRRATVSCNLTGGESRRRLHYRRSWRSVRK